MQITIEGGEEQYREIFTDIVMEIMKENCKRVIIEELSNNNHSLTKLYDEFMNLKNVIQCIIEHTDRLDNFFKAENYCTWLEKITNLDRKCKNMNKDEERIMAIIKRVDLLETKIKNSFLSNTKNCLIDFNIDN